MTSRSSKDSQPRTNSPLEQTEASNSSCAPDDVHHRASGLSTHYQTDAHRRLKDFFQRIAERHAEKWQTTTTAETANKQRPASKKEELELIFRQLDEMTLPQGDVLATPSSGSVKAFDMTTPMSAAASGTKIDQLYPVMEVDELRMDEIPLVDDDCSPRLLDRRVDVLSAEFERLVMDAICGAVPPMQALPDPPIERRCTSSSTSGDGAEVGDKASLELSLSEMTLGSSVAASSSDADPEDDAHPHRFFFPGTPLRTTHRRGPIDMISLGSGPDGKPIEMADLQLDVDLHLDPPSMELKRPRFRELDPSMTPLLPTSMIDLCLDERSRTLDEELFAWLHESIPDALDPRLNVPPLNALAMPTSPADQSHRHCRTDQLLEPIGLTREHVLHAPPSRSFQGETPVVLPDPDRTSVAQDVRDGLFEPDNYLRFVRANAQHLDFLAFGEAEDDALMEASERRPAERRADGDTLSDTLL